MLNAANYNMPKHLMNYHLIYLMHLLCINIYKKERDRFNFYCNAPEQLISILHATVHSLIVIGNINDQNVYSLTLCTQSRQKYTVCYKNGEISAVKIQTDSIKKL